MNEIELKFLLFVQEVFKNKFLDFFMPIVTKLGDAGIIWILTAVVLLFMPKFRKVGATMGLALCLGLLIANCGLKPLVQRVRPYDYLFNTTGENIKLLVAAQSDFSFPSGHTLASFESATVLLIANRRLGVYAMVLAVIIALSRIYLFMHYPSDVLFGALLGVGIGFLATYIVNKAIGTYKNRKAKKSTL